MERFRTGMPKRFDVADGPVGTTAPGDAGPPGDAGLPGEAGPPGRSVYLTGPGLKLAIVALVANAAYHVMSAYSSYYKFKDAVQQTALFGNDKSIDRLRARVVEIADTLLARAP